MFGQFEKLFFSVAPALPVLLHDGLLSEHSDTVATMVLKASDKSFLKRGRVSPVPLAKYQALL